ncbi:hypothetical protein [Pseudomonas asiatica]|uniref:hypothetical protein n=1 Tax=Pseudomonas asiatica TaxID=2219225 RepID=UPI00399B27E0
MQERNKPTEQELLDEAGAHYVASTFIIGHSHLTNQVELKRAADLQESSKKFLSERGYEPEKYDFKEPEAGTPQFLIQLTGKDARIPNYSEGIYWVVRATRISGVLKQYYPIFFSSPRP